MHRRGATLVETVLATALTALIVGVLAAMYGFTMVRLAHATANHGATADTTRLATMIASTVSDAYSCSTVTAGGVTGLKCVMPSTGKDRDGDTKLDSYRFTSVTPRGYETTTPGQRVWYYRASDDGAFGTTGTQVIRAIRSDDTNPTSADVDWAFVEALDGKSKYPLVSGLSFAVDSAAQTVTFTITSSALARAERTATGTGETYQSYGYTEARTVFWRNWR